MRAPPFDAAAAGKWRRERDVAAFADEEVRAAAVGDVVYAGIATRPNEDGTIFSALGTLHEYRPEEGTLRRLPATTVPAHHSAIASWNGHVYVFGGFTDGRASHHVCATRRRIGLTYDRRHAAPRGALTGDVINGRPLAVGGAEGALQRFPQIFHVLDVYDFDADAWTRGPHADRTAHSALPRWRSPLRRRGAPNRSQELDTFKTLSLPAASGRRDTAATGRRSAAADLVGGQVHRDRRR